MANEIVPFKQLMEGLAERFGVTPQEMIDTLKMQCFPGGAATNGQLMMLCSFAKQYDLNPLARECYAFVSTGGKHPGGMTVGVQVDGWTKIANRQETFDGQEMEYERDKDGELIAITSKTYVKNRKFPTIYRAVMKEWNRGKSSDVWKEMPEHQLFVKARNEGIRFAFGVSAWDPEDIARVEEAQQARKTIEICATNQQQSSDENITEKTGNESTQTGQNGSLQMDPASDAVHGTTSNSTISIHPQKTTLDSAEKSGTIEENGENSNSLNAKPSVDPATLQKLSLKRASNQDHHESGDTGRSATAQTTHTLTTDADAERALRANGNDGRDTAKEEGPDGKRKHLDNLIAKKVTAARLNLLLGQAGVEKVEDLSNEQVENLIKRLEKK